MKLLITLFSLVLLVSALSSFAQGTNAPELTPTPTPPPSLQNNMKALGTLMKDIAKNAQNSSMGPKLAGEAHEMALLFKTVATQVPSAILALPHGEQAAALLEFQSLIQKELDSSIALEKEFNAGNTAAAVAIIKDMSTVKKDGHTKFMPKPSPPPAP